VSLAYDIRCFSIVISILPLDVCLYIKSLASVMFDPPEVIALAHRFII
jgi:hypothetical protein